MQPLVIIHDTDFLSKIEDLKHTFSSKSEAIKEIDSVLNKLYRIKLYQNENNDSLERSIFLHYRLKLELNKIPEWKKEVLVNRPTLYDKTINFIKSKILHRIIKKSR